MLNIKRRISLYNYTSCAQYIDVRRDVWNCIVTMSRLRLVKSVVRGTILFVNAEGLEKLVEIKNMSSYSRGRPPGLRSTAVRTRLGALTADNSMVRRIIL